jgi:hypothetical protein
MPFTWDKKNFAAKYFLPFRYSPEPCFKPTEFFTTSLFSQPALSSESDFSSPTENFPQSNISSHSKLYRQQLLQSENFSEAVFSSHQILQESEFVRPETITTMPIVPRISDSPQPEIFSDPTPQPVVVFQQAEFSFSQTFASQKFSSTIILIQTGNVKEH